MANKPPRGNLHASPLQWPLGARGLQQLHCWLRACGSCPLASQGPFCFLRTEVNPRGVPPPCLGVRQQGKCTPTVAHAPVRALPAAWHQLAAKAYSPNEKRLSRAFIQSATMMQSLAGNAGHFPLLAARGGRPPCCQPKDNSSRKEVNQSHFDA